MVESWVKFWSFVDWLLEFKRKKDVSKKKNISRITLGLEPEQLGKCNCRVLRWGECRKDRLGKNTESLALDLLNLRCLLDCQVISNKRSKVWSASKNSQMQMIFKDMRPHWSHSGNEYKKRRHGNHIQAYSWWIKGNKKYFFQLWL